MGHPDFKASLSALKSSSRMGTGLTQLSLSVSMTLEKRVKRWEGANRCLR